MRTWKFCGILVVAAAFLINSGQYFFQDAKYSDHLLASDYPGPIAPIGPHGPPQPIDDEAIT